jgi:hypothetical protein
VPLRSSDPARPQRLRSWQKLQVTLGLRSRDDRCATRVRSGLRIAHPHRQGDSMRVLRIDPDTTVTDLDPPEPGAHFVIRDRIGATGTVDQGLGHRRPPAHPCRRTRERVATAASLGTTKAPPNGLAV